MRIVQLDKGIIYGPVNSRRLGRSLGVNLLSSHRKVCPYDCVYCQLRDVRTRAMDYASMRHRRCHFACTHCPDARTVHTVTPQDSAIPSAQEVLLAVEAAIKQHAPVDNVTFSGNGEPTIHPQFEEIVKGVRDLRDRLVPSASLAVLSCSATLRSEGVRRALKMIDMAVMKLDVGDEKSFQLLNRPCPGITFAEILEGLRDLRPAVVQSLVAGGPCGNDRPEQREKWLAALASAHPSEVQLYSISRLPAEGHVEVVPRERLEVMAREVAERLGSSVTVY